MWRRQRVKEMTLYLEVTVQSWRDVQEGPGDTGETREPLILPVWGGVSSEVWKRIELLSWDLDDE